MFHLFRKPLAVGIDISDYSIEVLGLNKNREIFGYSRALLEEGIVQDGTILKKEKLAAKLKELLANAKPNPISSPKNLKAIVSLPESKVFIHYFSVPKHVRGNVLKQKVFEESSKIIPLDPEQIVWDYTISPVKDMQRVVYIGTSKETVDSYVAVMNAAGIELLALDVESLSLSRSLLRQGSSMIVDIGARTANVSIFNRDKILAISVTIPLGGTHFTEAVARQLKVGVDEAEKIKRAFGFDKEKTGNKVFSILQTKFQMIVEEINKTIRYFEDKSGENIKEIVLAGGSALLPEVDTYLSEKFGKKVRIANPREKVKNGRIFGRKNPPILFANVIGLALRAGGNSTEGINLLERPSVKRTEVARKPRATQQRFLPTRRKRIFALLLGVVVLLVVGFVLYQYFSLSEEYPEAGPAVVESPEVDKLPAVPPEEEQEIDDVTEEALTLLIQDTPTGWLNVREGPGTSYARITRVYPGESYPLLEEKDNWYKIALDPEGQANGAGEGTEGWVTSQYVTKE